MPPLRVAVLFEAVQLSDIVCIDLLGNCSTAIITDGANSFPAAFQPLIPLAVDIEFLYVASTLKPATATPNIKIVPTHTYDSCPRDIDLLIVGGPLLSHRPEGSLRLMREVFELGKATVLTVCVGSWWVADSGTIEGRKVTTNRGALSYAKKMHPEIEWLDRRWVVDKQEGKCELWTGGGAGCGVDMMAAYITERYPAALAKASYAGLDWDPQVKDVGVEYSRKLDEVWGEGAGGSA